jgi:hypothetical protein
MSLRALRVVGRAWAFFMTVYCGGCALLYAYNGRFGYVAFMGVLTAINATALLWWLRADEA